MRSLVRAFFVLLLVGGPVAAQQIVGAIFVNTPGGSRIQLVSIGVGTGAVALIGAAPTDAASFTPITAYDPAGNFYYFLAGPTGPLYKVSTADGTFSSGALSGAAFDGVNDIEFDAAEGVLYALLRVNVDQMRLATIAVGGSLGAITLQGAGAFQGGAVQTYTFSVLDPTANRFYFVGGTTLKAVSTTTADVVNSGTTAGSLAGIEADGDSGALYANQSTGNPTFDRRILALSTANDGTFGSVLATGPGLAGGSLSTAGWETYDSPGNRYFLIAQPASGSNTLYAVNTPGLTLNDSDALAGVTTDPSALEFDPGPLFVALQSFEVD